MTNLAPLLFEPLFQPRPWGGRRLADLLDKPLPDGPPIGESWELVSLPNAESRVRGGPLAGATLHQLVTDWGERLLGGAALVAGRFPLLIKFLDARETLSVQVHPRQRADAGPEQGGFKNEAWYVIAAEPDAQLLIGLKPGITSRQFAAAAGSAACADMLERWPARPGRCYYLPSGVPHALGAGVVVAEVQTPLDTTYRLYDWDRPGLDGRPRTLHLREGVENLCTDVPRETILQPRSHAGGVFSTVSRLVSCASFLIDKVRLAAGVAQGFPHSEMVVWIVLGGAGEFLCADPAGPQRRAPRVPFKRGDVALIPADCGPLRVHTGEPCELLEVKLPIRSRLADFARPQRDPPQAPAPPGRAGPTRLTIDGSPAP